MTEMVVQMFYLVWFYQH